MSGAKKTRVDAKIGVTSAKGFRAGAATCGIKASRKPDLYAADLTDMIAYGASPRGTIALDLAARAHAWLDNRD